MRVTPWQYHCRVCCLPHRVADCRQHLAAFVLQGQVEIAQQPQERGREGGQLRAAALAGGAARPHADVLGDLRYGSSEISEQHTGCLQELGVSIATSNLKRSTQQMNLNCDARLTSVTSDRRSSAASSMPPI